jgi:hypothetical protein
MPRSWFSLVLLGCLLAAVPGGPAAPPDSQPAPAPPAGDPQRDLAGNRRLLEKWRADPEHALRLQRDLEAFGALPPAQQQRLRSLDHDLHALPPATRERLWKVLERYRTWLERLPEAQRQAIEAADGPERLRLIREIRARQYLDRLPLPVRQELLRLSPDQRAERIKKLRQTDRERRARWQRPPRYRPDAAARPARLADFPPEVQDFVKDVLQPRLSAAEKGRLRAAEGRWPQLARAILELAERHAVLPPPRWVSLPPNEFPAPVQAFLKDKLLPALTPAERQRLRKAEGRWPQYPRLVLELARQHHLAVPGVRLPGPRELWEQARAAGP